MSVRLRTTLAATLVVALALLAGSVVLVRTLDHSLTTAADQQSRARLAELLDGAVAGTLPRTVAGISDDSLAQVVDGSGRVLAASDNLTGRPAVARVEDTARTPRVRTMRGLPDDQETEDYRIWAASTATPAGTVAVFVGPSLEASQEAVGRLVTSLEIGLPMLLALLVLAIWVTVGRALRPVEGVRREVAGLGARNLDRRVPVPATHDEVARLATTMNAMLDRLQEADRRQREFVGNASHDLQSPLAVLRSELELALAEGDSARWPETGRILLQETDRMEALVADLLFLARADEEGEQPARNGLALDLEDVVAEEVSRLAYGGRVDLAASGAPVRGNRSQLARMVRNLLLNATRFAHSQVTVRVGEDEAGGILVVVDDDGPGVPEEHREEVFERFVTLDPARSRAAGGTGLGLAIARSVAQAHGGSLVMEGPSRFVVRLPGLRPAVPSCPEHARSSEASDPSTTRTGHVDPGNRA